MRKTRIFINGFGRIGRSAARIILGRDDMELVGINDLYAAEQMAYLLKYDSVYETLSAEIRAEEHALRIDGYPIPVYQQQDPASLDLRPLEVDVLLQCSGMFLTEASNRPYIENGAGRVLVSTPPSDAMPTYICGVNTDTYAQEPILSNSSCSANAIVPILKSIEKHCGIRGVQMHMFHSYTAYQNLLDVKHYGADIRRARAAAANIIPLSSSAAKATAYFFPKLEGKLYAKSIRIPVAATTMYDLLIKLDGSYDLGYIRERLLEEIAGQYQGILSSSTEPKVSSDYIASTYSATIDLPLLDLAGDNLLRVSAWQDNEYGYACRLVEMAKVVSAQLL